MEIHKLKNRFHKDGGYVCGGVGIRGCGRDTGFRIIRGIVYCRKCSEIIRGVRDEKGIPLPKR